MVLTQLDVSDAGDGYIVSVSIPLWFLRNLDKKPTKEILGMFPYHYGSYKSSPPLTVQEHGPVHRKDQRPDPEQELFRMTK